MQNAFFNLIVAGLLSFATQPAMAQGTITPAQADSLSWKYYLSGDWDSLIEIGEQAQQQGIGFKYLHQRMGYAWYLKGDYYKSKQHYQKALRYDSDDETTLLYLYYSQMATGHLLSARYHAAGLPVETRTLSKITRQHWLNSVDAEYSYKRPDAFYRDNDLRGDGFYRRFGLHTLPGYRLAVYQSLSGFQQSTEFGNSTRQLEYLGSVSAQVSAPITLTAAYHFTGTRYTQLPDSFYLPGHQIAARINYQWRRFDFSASGSHLTNSYLQVNQIGLHWGTGFSLPASIYLKTSVYWLTDTWDDSTTPGVDRFAHTVVEQSVGAMVWKNRLWVEANVTLGNQNYFTVADGLYFYNSPDPIVQKSGVQLTAFLTKNLSTTLHYGIEKKHWIANDEYYYQQGLTGGIIWKL